MALETRAASNIAAGRQLACLGPKFPLDPGVFVGSRKMSLVSQGQTQGEPLFKPLFASKPGATQSGGRFTGASIAARASRVHHLSHQGGSAIPVPSDKLGKIAEHEPPFRGRAP
jgi:hypothetical protein